MTRSVPAQQKMVPYLDDPATTMQQEMKQPSASAEPRHAPQPDRGASLLVTGAALLLLALTLFGASRVVAAGQQHAYDPGASPRPAYSLTAGKTYQLSSARSVAELKQSGSLTDLKCFFTTGTGLQTPVTLSSTMDDDRNLHVFATMVAPVTAAVHLSCATVTDVFIDDADDAAPDRSALLVLLSIAAGLPGVIAACSGGYALSSRRQPVESSAEAG